MPNYVIPDFKCVLAAERPKFETRPVYFEGTAKHLYIQSLIMYEDFDDYKKAYLESNELIKQYVRISWKEGQEKESARSSRANISDFNKSRDQSNTMKKQ